ncbi:hypothetical protein GCM10012285_43830 [Streptomyces kronopolitis]|uniref:Uncharacterized protein n=1 Tax=Streptomyces kronopolitis TaxID=1612435 RepID=A0ABQ2JRM7_9ACTN|nr:hypothetical protein GCM10012285_43830 [Streptomyces kronopolitis]
MNASQQHLLDTYRAARRGEAAPPAPGTHSLRTAHEIRGWYRFRAVVTDPADPADRGAGGGGGRGGGWFAGRLAGRFAGRFAGRWPGRLAGRLSGRGRRHVRGVGA